MKLRRPQSLNGLILVGFGLVALPLLGAVIWALINTERLANLSEQLVDTGVRVAENNRLLDERLATLERAARQYEVLRSDESLRFMQDDMQLLENRLGEMAPLVAKAEAGELAVSIGRNANQIVRTLSGADVTQEQSEAAIARFGLIRQQVDNLGTILTGFVDNELRALQESTRSAQRVSAWQVAALVPGTIFLIVLFTLVIGKPIRQIDKAIHQLGESGFSRPIVVKGPTDLERLGRQLEWLRIRLLELAQEKNRFLRHMSHELKTPLANIREGTELLLDGTVGELDKPQREVTDILRMNGLKLQNLIENLLSFSAWQTKNEILTLTDFPLRALAISVAKEQRLALKSADIQLKLEVQDIVVNADRDKMRSVLENLLSNAVKFTPPGGFVTIRAAETPDSFVIDFADTGPGIPVEERARIFEAFFQGRREQGGHVQGTGIGLSVVLECVQAHEGAVDLIDSEEFSGAHFRISIPQTHVKQQPKMAANA